MLLEETTRVALLAALQLLRCALENYLATIVARLWTEVDNPVSALDDIHIMLYDNYCVTVGNQRIERLQQAVDIALRGSACGLG